MNKSFNSSARSYFQDELPKRQGTPGGILMVKNLAHQQLQFETCYPGIQVFQSLCPGGVPPALTPTHHDTVLGSSSLSLWHSFKTILFRGVAALIEFMILFPQVNQKKLTPILLTDAASTLPASSELLPLLPEGKLQWRTPQFSVWGQGTQEVLKF